MANLFPAAAQTRVWRSYRAHFVLVASLALALAALVAFAVLVPAYLVLRAQQKVPAAEPVGVSEGSEREDVAHARLLVGELLPLASSSAPSIGVLGSVLEARPNDVFVRTISYTRGGNGHIVLTGKAGSRDSISEYRSALSKYPLFTSASVPLRDLSGVSDGRFTITLMGSF